MGASGLYEALSLHHASNARVGRAGDLHDPSNRRKIDNPCVVIESIVNGESSEGDKLPLVWREWRPRRRDPRVARNSRLVADIERHRDYVVPRGLKEQAWFRIE